MKHINISIAVFCLALFSSCITSYNGLVTYDKVITDDRILGSWIYDNMMIEVEPLVKSKIARELKKDMAKESGDILKGESKTDSLLYLKSYVFNFEKKGISHHMLTNFIRLNGELFIDIKPIVAYENDTLTFSDKSADIMYPGLKETHSFAKVVFLNSKKLQLKFLSPGFIEKQLRQQHIAIKHEQDEMTGDFLITAPSSALQQFLIKYGKDERLYSNENNIILDKIK
jgi:hypothetical protein